MLDIVVFGATGDVGRVVCSYLFSRGKLAGVTSWAPAGRNLKKIAATLGPIGTDAASSADGVTASAPIQADAADLGSCVAMAKQAKVVIACAGPFALMGEAVIAACIEAGTDYVDITGEVPWVAAMNKKYGAEAKRKGITLVPMSGYDSVPSDITTWSVFNALKAEDEELASVETCYRNKGAGLPSGTVNTIIHGVGTARAAALTALTFGMVGKNSAKPCYRGPKPTADAPAAEPLFPAENGKLVSRDMWSNLLNPWSAARGVFTIPHFMLVANVPVVHATARRLGYPGIVYRERMEVTKPSLFNVWGLIPVAINTAVYVALAVLACTPFFNAVMRTAVAQGDTKKAETHSKLMDDFKPSGAVKVSAIGFSKSGKLSAKADLKADYDAGLGFTTQCAVAVAAALLPASRTGKGVGFGTAVGAVGGAALVESLGRNGVSIDVSRSKL